MIWSVYNKSFLYFFTCKVEVNIKMFGARVKDRVLTTVSLILPILSQKIFVGPSEMSWSSRSKLVIDIASLVPSMSALYSLSVDESETWC